jgi:hypothetical protein
MGIAAAMLVCGVLVGLHGISAPPPSPDIAELRAELHDVRQMLALSLMQQQSATERLRGVDWIALIDFIVETRDTDAVAQLRDLSKNPDANEAVRGRATRSLSHLGS